MMYLFEITPKPQARARTFRRGSKTITWDPTQDYKNDIRKLIPKFLKENFTGPVELEVLFLMPIPKSMTKKAREALKNDPRHIKKPDAKNLYAALEDALTSFVYKDDSLIWKFSVEKIYSENPGIQIQITGENYAKPLRKKPATKKKEPPSKSQEVTHGTTAKKRKKKA